MTSPRDPIATKRQPAIVGNDVLTVPVSEEVADALNDAAVASHEALTVALAPFGLHPYDIARPEFRRVVYRDELEGKTP